MVAQMSRDPSEPSLITERLRQDFSFMKMLETPVDLSEGKE
jgi:hypothetical protein